MANATNQGGRLTVVAVVVAALAVAATLGVQHLLGRSAGASQGVPAGSEPASSAAPAGPPPAPVRVEPARLESVQDRFEVVGRLQEIRRATVAAEVAGKVLQVPVEEGDVVVGGQTVLAKIDDVWSRLNLEAAQAELAAARAQLDQSQRDLRYLEELQAGGSARPKEVEDARAQVQSDQARLDAAAAARDRAAQEVQRLQVVAPFDGVVIRKLTEVGQWVTQGSPVVEIISRGQIDALVDVPERLINQVRIGDSLELTIEPLGLVCTGEVVSVTPYGGNAARTFPVKIRLGDRGGALKAGMSVVAHLPMGEPSPKLTVPRDAVLFRPAGAVVWAVVQGGGPMPTASAVRVQVLFGEKDRYVIDPSTDALAQGTPVVIEGAERLMEGQPLMILESPVSAEAGSAAPPQNLVASGG